jgi:hypothetical protein
MVRVGPALHPLACRRFLHTAGEQARHQAHENGGDPLWVRIQPLEPLQREVRPRPWPWGGEDGRWASAVGGGVMAHGRKALGESTKALASVAAKVGAL